MKRESLVDRFYSLFLINLNRDAASLVDTIFTAVKYLHESGIVHRGMTDLPFFFTILACSWIHQI
jgi:hypothetical protein